MSQSKLLKILSKEQYENQVLIDKIKLDYKVDTSEETRIEFETACENFRQICYQIGQAIGNPDFKGGFDEMLEFQNSDVANTQLGLLLAMKWSAADKLCTYIADRKLKIGQPAWWKQCWNIQELIENKKNFAHDGYVTVDEKSQIIENVQQKEQPIEIKEEDNQSQVVFSAEQQPQKESWFKKFKSDILNKLKF